jgi:hypothetical protein
MTIPDYIAISVLIALALGFVVGMRVRRKS